MDRRCRTHRLTFLKTESSKRITDRVRSWWLLVVDESVSSDDESCFCSKIVSFFDLSRLVLLEECLIGLARAWINGRSGDSSANGIFSPSVSGRCVGLWMCNILLVTVRRGFDIWLWLVSGLSSLSDESTDEFLNERNLLSSMAVKDDRPSKKGRKISSRVLGAKQFKHQSKVIFKDHKKHNLLRKANHSIEQTDNTTNTSKYSYKVRTSLNENIFVNWNK